MYKRGVRYFDVYIFMCYLDSYFRIKMQYFVFLFLSKIIDVLEIFEILNLNVTEFLRDLDEVEGGVNIELLKVNG